MSYIQHIYIIIIAVSVIANHTNSETIRCQKDEDCQCSKSITGATCILDCSRDPDTCKESALTCRGGDPCIIKCENTATCKGETIIDAQTATDVTIICSGSDACKDEIDIRCGIGSCQLQCLTSKSCIGWGSIDVSLSTSFTCLGAYCPNSIPDQFTISPTPAPTPYPIRANPTFAPANIPTSKPTKVPTTAPTAKPSHSPTIPPTVHGQTATPTISPTPEPTEKPTHETYPRTVIPSMSPTPEPTSRPTYETYPPTIITSISTTNTFISTTWTSMIEFEISEESVEIISNSDGNGINIMYLIIGGLVVSMIIIFVGMKMRKKRKQQYYAEEIGDDKLPNSNDTVINKRSNQLIVPEEMHDAFGRVQSAGTSSRYSYMISLKGSAVSSQKIVDECESDDDEKDNLAHGNMVTAKQDSERNISDIQTSHFIGDGECMSPSAQGVTIA